MVEKRQYRSDRYRLIPVSAVYTRGERLHKIRDRPSQIFFEASFSFMFRSSSATASAFFRAAPLQSSRT